MPTLINRALDRATETLQRLRGKDRGGLEVGFGGSHTGGLAAEEHVAELRGVAALRMATKMRRSTAQVRATAQIISLPIRSTSWFVEEPDGAGSTEKEAAGLLRENLFGGMEGSWDDLLREACLAIYYGFRVPEIVWTERKGLIAVQKLASRNPELIERWEYDAAGQVAGYRYSGNRTVGGGTGTIPVTRYEQVSIALEKTLHFVYDGENESPTGFGLWRSMYQHWYFYQAILKVLGIGIERNLLDVPVGKLGAGQQEKDRKALLGILRRWRAAEDAAVVLAEGQDLDFKGSNRALIDAMPFLQHHATMILQTGLCAFLNLGQTGAGTQALGTVLVRMFETAEEANARWIEQTVNSQLVKRWCLLNYGEKLKCPQVRHKPIRSNDLAAWSNALSTLMSSGALHPTVDDEQYLRDMLELPAIEKAQLLKMEVERKALAEQAGGAGKPDQKPGEGAQEKPADDGANAEDNE